MKQKTFIIPFMKLKNLYKINITENIQYLWNKKSSLYHSKTLLKSISQVKFSILIKCINNFGYLKFP